MVSTLSRSQLHSVVFRFFLGNLWILGCSVLLDVCTKLRCVFFIPSGPSLQLLVVPKEDDILQLVWNHFFCTFTFHIYYRLALRSLAGLHSRGTVADNLDLFDILDLNGEPWPTR